MGYTSTSHNPFSDTALDAELGFSGSVETAALAQDGCKVEMRQWSSNVTQAREHDRYMTDSWKGDAGAKTVLMFVSSFQPTT